VAIGLVLVIETGALHLILVGRHPWWGWSATMASLASLAWLVADYRRQGGAGLELGPTHWVLRRGGGAALVVPLAQLTRVSRPTWRELPPPGTAGYVNVARPLDPNLLLEFAGPLPLEISLGVRRQVRLLGLHVATPDAVIEAYTSTRVALAGGDGRGG
jgi:hypothetical protein